MGEPIVYPFDLDLDQDHELRRQPALAGVIMSILEWTYDGFLTIQASQQGKMKELEDNVSTLQRENQQLRQEMNQLKEKLAQLPSEAELHEVLVANTNEAKHYTNAEVDKLWRHNKSRNVVAHLKRDGPHPSLSSMANILGVTANDIQEVQHIVTATDATRESLLYRVTFRNTMVRDSVFGRRDQIETQHGGLKVKSDTTYFQRKQWQEITTAQQYLSAAGVNVQRPNLYTLWAVEDGVPAVRVHNLQQAKDLVQRAPASSDRHHQDNANPTHTSSRQQGSQQRNIHTQPQQSGPAHDPVRQSQQQNGSGGRRRTVRCDRGGHRHTISTRSQTRIERQHGASQQQDTTTDTTDIDNELHHDPTGTTTLPSQPLPPPPSPRPSRTYAQTAAIQRPVPLATNTRAPQPTTRTPQPQLMQTDPEQGIGSPMPSQQRDTAAAAARAATDGFSPPRLPVRSRIPAPSNLYQPTTINYNRYALLASQDDEPASPPHRMTRSLSSSQHNVPNH